MSIIENLIVNNSNESQSAKYIDVTFSTIISCSPQKQIVNVIPFRR